MNIYNEYRSTTPQELGMTVAMIVDVMNTGLKSCPLCGNTVIIDLDSSHVGSTSFLRHPIVNNCILSGHISESYRSSIILSVVWNSITKERLLIDGFKLEKGVKDAEI